MKNKIEILKIISKNCSICGKSLMVKLFNDRTYKGGHYFKPVVKNLDARKEYWECSRCYEEHKK